MIKLRLEDSQETAEFNVIERPLVTKPIIAETDVRTIDNNISTYLTGTNKRQLELSLGFLDAQGYETLRGFRDRQYALLKYPKAEIITDSEIGISFGQNIPSERIVKVNLGKNLFDKNNANTLGAYISGGTPHTITMDGSNLSVYLSCQPNTTYTISKIADNVFRAGTTTTTPASGVTVNDYMDNASGTSITLTSSSDAKYLVLFLRNVSTTHTQAEILDSLQIEKGSSATSYAPYFTPIELCKIDDYQDKIYKEGDDWYLKKAVRHLSLSPADMNNTENYPGWKNISEIRTDFGANKNGAAASFSNCYSNVCLPDAINGCHIAINTNASNSIVFIVDSGITQTTWKTDYADEQIEIYYGIINTQPDTKITNETLIAQLEALTESAFDGWTRVQVEAQSGNLAPSITVSQGTLSGTGTDVMLNGTTEDLLDFVIFGDTFQQTYSGVQLVTKQGMSTPISDTTFWNTIASDISFTPLTDGWGRYVQTNSSSSVFGNLYANYSAVDLELNTDYTVIFEFKNVTATSGQYDVAQRTASADPFTTLSAISGCSYNGTNIGIAINGNNTFAVFKGHTKASATSLSIRTFTRPNFPQGKGFDIRVSYIKGDHSSDWQNYCGANYQPYVGGVPAPNPNYPQAIRAVTGENTFDFTGPEGMSKYEIRGKLSLSDERIVDMCGTHENVSITIRESEQL